jgi:hypothetical protein
MRKARGHFICEVPTQQMRVKDCLRSDLRRALLERNYELALFIVKILISKEPRNESLHHNQYKLENLISKKKV